MKRRHFFQSAGATIAALGISQLDLHQQSLRYAKVLAQSLGPKHSPKASIIGGD